MAHKTHVGGSRSHMEQEKAMRRQGATRLARTTRRSRARWQDSILAGGVVGKEHVVVIMPPVAETFELPSRDDLLSLREGDKVKVMCYEEGFDVGERTWLLLIKKLAMDCWMGVPDCEPLLLNVNCRDKLLFHPLAVINVAAKPEPRGKE